MFASKPSVAEYNSLTVFGDTVVLIPYTRDLVPIYHEWMKDPYIQEMTCSEPLSLEEELEMHQTWLEDKGKLTFIVAAYESDLELNEKEKQDDEEAVIDLQDFISSTTIGKSAPLVRLTREEQIRNLEETCNLETYNGFKVGDLDAEKIEHTLSSYTRVGFRSSTRTINTAKNSNDDTEDITDAKELLKRRLIPCGDVNLFALDDSNSDSDTESEGGLQTPDGGSKEDFDVKTEFSEVDIMIAASSCRRRGLAKEALKLIMAFANEELGIKKFRAKILEKNEASLCLFKHLKFKEECRLECFKEIWLDNKI